MDRYSLQNNDAFLSRRKFATLLSIIVSVSTIGYMISQLGYATIVATFRQLDVGWLAVAVILMLLNYLFRAIRFQQLLYNPQLGFWQIFSVTCLHGMFNYLMPAKTGEISFFMLLKQRLQVPIASSTPTLIMARLLDFSVIAFFLPIVVIAFWSQLPTVIIIVALIFCGLTYLVVSGLMVYFYWQDITVELIPSDVRLTFKQRIFILWQKVMIGMQLITQRGQFVSLLLATTVIWFCVYSYSYAMVLSLGYSVDFFHVIAVSLMSIPVTLLPFQGVAGLGTHEVSWIFVFTLFGYSYETALAIAVGTHGIVFGLVLFMGGMGAVLSIKELQVKSSSEE